MIYLLLISLVVLFLFCYLFSGKDFFAPAAVQLLTFVGSVLMCIYFMWSMDAPYEFHWATIEIIALTMAMTGIIGIVVHHLFSKIKIQAHTPESVDISPISSGVSILFVGIIFFTMIWILAELRRIGGTSGSFGNIVSRFHALNSYSTEEFARLPFLLRQLLKITRVLLLLYGFNFIRFFHKMKTGQKCMNILILGFCIVTLLITGGRTSTVNQLIGYFVIFHLLRIQKDGRYKQYGVKALIRIVLFLIVILIFFFLVKNFVGRNSRNETMNLADYIAYYTGSQYITLDQYFQRPPSASGIFGKETFYSMNQFLINYKLVDGHPYIVHLEFRPIGTGFSTNVYTFLRSYHCDFGMVGMYLLHGLSILFMTLFYEYVKKRRGNLGILIFGQMYYTIVLSFFAERFYSKIFSVDYVGHLLLLISLYELFIRKRIRLKFRWTAHVLQPVPIQQEPNTVDS